MTTRDDFDFGALGYALAIELTKRGGRIDGTDIHIIVAELRRVATLYAALPTIVLKEENSMTTNQHRDIGVDVRPLVKKKWHPATEKQVKQVWARCTDQMEMVAQRHADLIVSRATIDTVACQVRIYGIEKGAKAK